MDHAHFFAIDSTLNYFAVALGAVPYNIWVFLGIGLFSAVFAELIWRLVFRFGLRLMNLYVIPQSEGILLLLVYLCFRNFAVGAVNLIFMISPVAYSFGAILVDFVATAMMFFFYFRMLKKYYLNDKTAPFVFKLIAIPVLVYYAVSCVNLLLGGMV